MKLSECKVGMYIKQFGSENYYEIESIHACSVSTHWLDINEKQLENYECVDNLVVRIESAENVIRDGFKCIYSIDSLNEKLHSLKNYIYYLPKDWVKVDSDKITNEIKATINKLNETIVFIKNKILEEYKEGLENE